MLLRLCLLVIVAILLAGAVSVFEASAATAISLSLAQDAARNDSEGVRERLLDRAETVLTQSWARPAQWHAGAMEALSAIHLLRSRDAGDDEGREAAQWAVRALAHGPVQPNALNRLAALDAEGITNRLCELRTCLELSWRSAPLLDMENECARLHMAHSAGMLEPFDERLLAFARTASPRVAGRCLARFLPARETFAILLQARR